ncbi:hypothetical protein QTP70_026807, partial [Hemibagrus guttatus]
TLSPVLQNTDWNKYDDRLMKAVEKGEVDKVSAVLSKKGIIPTKLDVEGRSAFHLAASRGHLDCLSVILVHGVDVTANDATGKNALHLSARNGHSLCVQKLLQHNCPVGNVDLQGRTALHDAVMAGCSSSVKLLCDSGASVNASDFDGRTPLVLATQMCHPHICQLLLERGADIRVREKAEQNTDVLNTCASRTALILGCEFACKDAVEVLLKSGADITAVDSFGHDSYHYARLSKNQELINLIKSYLDNAKGKITSLRTKQASRVELKKRQDLEKQNESQQEILKKYHQEQRALLDKVSVLQQQLCQEKSVVEDIHKEHERRLILAFFSRCCNQREHLKRMLSAREKETTAPETVKVQLRSHLGDYSGQSVIKGKETVLVRQGQSLDSAQVLQPSVPSRSLSRPLELSHPVIATPNEVETLRQELRSTRKQQEAAQEEVERLQAALARKTKECEELVQSRDATKRESDRQIQELEGALGDVQKRMLDSESKVKQLQQHVITVKEHLGNQMLDDLKAQLNEVKVKYEGASAEVGRVRNHLKQSEKALEEYKKSEGVLAEEVEKLTGELNALRDERDEMAASLLEMETHVKEAEKRLGIMVPGEKFDNMKNLLSNAVDEKERQLVELREDYDRVLEEVAELHREVDHRDTVPFQEHERLRVALEEQSDVLKKKLADVTSKCQSLICEVEDGEDEKELLREELHELGKNLRTQFVPVETHEKLEKTLNLALEELKDQLDEATGRRNHAEEQLRRLQEEMNSLTENMSILKSTHIPNEKYEKIEDQKKELDTIHEAIQSKFVPLSTMEEKEKAFKTTVKDLREELAKMEEKYKKEGYKGQMENLSLKLVELEQQYMEEAQAECKTLTEAYNLEVQRIHKLEKELQSHSTDSDLLEQNSHARETLEREVAKLRLALREEEEISTQRAEDVSTLQSELLRATHALDELRSHEGQLVELKAEKQRLEEEVGELSDRLLGLEEQCEELYQDAAKAKEAENRAKMETEALQTKSSSIEKEIQDLKERYDDSLSTIGDLQKRIHTSSEQTEAKDKRITELLADVERLKQALNGLSQLAYTGNTPNKRHAQHIDTLQAQVKSLQQQLADAERQHREVVSIYRTHLLSAAQGHMDEDVQAALLQIIRMRQQFVC